MYLVVSKSLRPDQLFKVPETKQIRYFSIKSPLISTHTDTDNINLTIDGSIYPSLHFPFGAVFVRMSGRKLLDPPLYKFQDNIKFRKPLFSVSVNDYFKIE